MPVAIAHLAELRRLSDHALDLEVMRADCRHDVEVKLRELVALNAELQNVRDTLATALSAAIETADDSHVARTLREAYAPVVPVAVLPRPSWCPHEPPCSNLAMCRDATFLNKPHVRAGDDEGSEGGPAFTRPMCSNSEG